MKLPRPPQQYNEQDQAITRAMEEQADAENHKRNRDLEVSPGRLIIKSPNGTRYSITVSNTGTISATAL